MQDEVLQPHRHLVADCMQTGPAEHALDGAADLRRALEHGAIGCAVGLEQSDRGRVSPRAKLGSKLPLERGRVVKAAGARQRPPRGLAARCPAAKLAQREVDHAARRPGARWCT